MGWIEKQKKDSDVRGIIVAGQFDKKLSYAMAMVPNIEVFLYEVNFTLKEHNEGRSTRRCSSLCRAGRSTDLIFLIKKI
ncbi:MAG: hypothetical protein O3B03_06650 [Proteobacteria bacterium]|nr:hypothetical protein [Pseudomonadota bacterium]MDA1332188.1 hypothetical protein [Pseudomonadota bacterium]